MAHIKTLEDFKKNMVLVDKGIAENSKWCHRTGIYGDLSEVASSRWRGSEEQYQHCNLLA